MYLLKIKGSGKIPNYLQIRDDEYTLLAYFRLDKLEDGLIKNHLNDFFEDIKIALENLEFGVIIYISLTNKTKL